MDRERLNRIRNFQSNDWYPALVVRPLTILFLLVFGDWKVLTPNRMTTLANVFKLCAAWAMLYREHWILAAILLQLGLLFDHVDGTLARYRRAFTKFGSFYDKVSDMVTWWPIICIAGWMAYRETGEAWYILLATTSATAMNIRAYMKWVAVAESERLRWFEARQDPVAAVAAKTKPIVIPPPPARTPREWLWFVVSRMWRVFWFEEMDLWFWLSLALVIDRLPWCIWLLFVTQVAGCLGMIVIRHVELHRVDQKLAALERTYNATPSDVLKPHSS